MSCHAMFRFVLSDACSLEVEVLTPLRLAACHPRLSLLFTRKRRTLGLIALGLIASLQLWRGQCLHLPATQAEFVNLGVSHAVSCRMVV